MILYVNCPLCDKQQSIEIDPQDFTNYQNGYKIQDAFPHLTPNEREIIQSGICTDCWPS